MPLSLFGGASLRELVQAEVEIERNFTEVDLDVAAVARLAKQQNIPLTLVSDTYFTAEQLAFLLDRPGLEVLREARVFRSHEHGIDKASGLWGTVLGELGTSAEQVVHIGDNPVADRDVPGGLGIRTVHYERIDDDLARVLDREQEPADPLGAYPPQLDQEHGDFGITSLRAKTLQAGGRKNTSPAGSAWRFGASVLGPVLTGFAEWVACTAAESGFPILWCPMREGELLSELVNNAAKARGLTVQARPIWLSRQVTSIAALDCTDRESVQAFIRKRHRLTVRQLLDMLHLRAGDVPHLAEDLDKILDNSRIAEQMSVALTETPHLANRLAVTTTAARERLLDVLRAAGALASPELPLVDLGWGGTIQLQLAEVLRIAQLGVTPAGFYLATDERSTRLHQAGLRAEGYLGQAGHPRETVGVLARSPEVVEQSVNALCGSLVDFAADGSPILGAVADTAAQLAERRAVQDGILAFQRQWNRQAEHSAARWPRLTGSARDRLATILVSALRLPTPQEAAVFGNWRHEDNFGSTVVTRVLPEDLAPAVPYLSPSDLDDLRMRDSFWPALLAASDPHLGAAARAVAAGLIDPAMFEPAGEPSATTLRYRTADDTWHDGPTRRVRINHNGLSFARMDFEAVDVTDVSLAVPGRPALVRIDWIEANVISDGRPHTLLWNTTDGFAELGYVDCARLGANLVEFYSPLAAVWLPLAERCGSTVTSVQVTVAFAMLPRSRSGLGYRMVPAADHPSRLSMRIRRELRGRGAAGLAADAARSAARRLRGR